MSARPSDPLQRSENSSEPDDSELDALGPAGRRALFGDKGADLWEFARRLREAGARAPAFRLLDTRLLDEHRHRHGPPPIPRHPGLPTYFSVDPEALVWAAPFATAAADLALDGCAVKSSIVWPCTGPRPSGVDLTAFVRTAADRAPVLTWVAAGFAKAYTTLCLRHAGHDPAVAPCSGLIVMDAVPPALLGTAFLAADGGAVVEIGAPRGPVWPAATSAELAASGALPAAAAAELDRLLALLSGDVGAGAVGEVELIVDHDGELHLLQLTVRDAGPGPGPALLAGVGEATGAVLDLRGLARAQATEDDLRAHVRRPTCRSSCSRCTTSSSSTPFPSRGP